MIATLSGTITEKTQQFVVLETAGVGYGVAVPSSDFDGLHISEQARLYIHEVIREDTHDLYGFIDLLGRELFLQLLGVSGVGPKAALAILSVAGVEQAQKAISTGDVAFLTAASGVGKRTAERVAVELRNKVIAADYQVTGDNDNADAALQALEALGYPRSAAAQALAKVPGDLSDEARIKAALKEIQ